MSLLKRRETQRQMHSQGRRYEGLQGKYHVTGRRDWSEKDENQGALGEKHGADSPSGAQEEAGRWAPLLWTSSHLNCERVDFCWLKWSDSGTLLWQPWEINALPFWDEWEDEHQPGWLRLSTADLNAKTLSLSGSPWGYWTSWQLTRLGFLRWWVLIHWWVIRCI